MPTQRKPVTFKTQRSSDQKGKSGSEQGSTVKEHPLLAVNTLQGALPQKKVPLN
jgi:hypothetical protein